MFKGKQQTENIMPNKKIATCECVVYIPHKMLLVVGCWLRLLLRLTRDETLGTRPSISCYHLAHTYQHIQFVALACKCGFYVKQNKISMRRAMKIMCTTIINDILSNISCTKAYCAIGVL